MTRRTFISAGVLGALFPRRFLSGSVLRPSRYRGSPVVISTWRHGQPANREAMKVLDRGGSVLDAVEQGIRVVEADPDVRSVGLGGHPDEKGNVTLDACIMDSTGNAGSVAFLQDIRHPVSVARKVMEVSGHVMLAGDGAREFALVHGFQSEDLLTPESEREWLEWKTSSERDRRGHEPSESHDTISVLAQDGEGNLAGACSTSGMAYKIYGRVGDSPIIGAGLFCDNEIGAAGATGRGEEVMKTVGSFLVVELMRQGRTPQEACEEALRRILKRTDGVPDFQVAYIALRADGITGAAALKEGFQFALATRTGDRLVDVSPVSGD
ncbi:MAG: N(4)-(beta-N-acetylglucosaminyl)-L-asparaginase [Fidelibacterota bacterium]